MTAPTIERSAVVAVSVLEFKTWVALLAEAAGIVLDKVDDVVPDLTIEEAVALLDQCREAVRQVERSGDRVSARVAELWDAGREAVLDVEGVLVELDVKHRKDRRHWDHLGLMRQVVGRHLERAAADGRVPDPYEVGEWVLTAALPSYWRLQVLAELGIDPEPYCRPRDEIPAVEIRPARGGGHT